MDTITTYTGEDFAPRCPDPGKLHLRDIAHALSLLTRANGHFAQFYSVGQHSLNCAKEAAARGCTPLVQLAALLHDASEAYLCDIPRPLKRAMEAYRQDEARLQRCVEEKYLPGTLSDADRRIIRAIDDEMMIWEFHALMPRKDVFPEHPPMASTPDFSLRPFSEVEEAFLAAFEALSAACGA